MADKKPLLVIELDKINSVPRVFYNGEQITNLINVAFEWETETARISFGSPFIDIEHAVTEDGREKPYTKSIRYNGYFKKDDCKCLDQS